MRMEHGIIIEITHRNIDGEARISLLYNPKIISTIIQTICIGNVQKYTSV